MSIVTNKPPAPAEKPKEPETTALVYIGGVYPIDVPTLGLFGVNRFDVIDATPELLGKARHWRDLKLDENGDISEEVWVGYEYRVHEGKDQVNDPGTGFLAQPENWRLADDEEIKAHKARVAKLNEGTA